MVQVGRIPSGVPAAVQSPRSWLIAMTLIAVVGGGLAIGRASPAWWRISMPLSNLGVDHGAAGTVTATMLGLGLILLALGLSLGRSFARLHAAGRVNPRAQWPLTIGFGVAGLAAGLTGLFPINGGMSTVIHNVAGYAMPIVLMATLIGARLTLGSLGTRFDLISTLIALTVIALYAATARVQLLPYGVMELICFALIGAWLWLFEARLRSLVRA
jgi:hypothetical protein